jgi:glucose/arabinose dehydrogenase
MRARELALIAIAGTVVVLLLSVTESLPASWVVKSEAGKLKVDTVASGLAHPWGIAFLPDGRLRVTERPGRMRIVSKRGELSRPLQGVPRVFAQGQGGLLDVVLDPDFASNRLVYFSFAEPGEGGARTAVGRGELGDDSLEDVQIIYRQEPKVDGGNHFGSRLAFAQDGEFFITQDERFKFTPAQDLSSLLGKIVRLNRN